MSRAVLDIETDALDATMIHCLGVKEVGNNEEVKFFTTSEGVQEYLDKFDTLIAHNGVGFDFPILARVWGIHIDTIYHARSS